MQDKHFTEVLDALAEAAIARPEIAGTSRFHVRPGALLDALQFIPDEHHARGSELSIGERFVRSVIANAKAADRSAYTVALFALDVA